MCLTILIAIWIFAGLRHHNFPAVLFLSRHLFPCRQPKKTNPLLMEYVLPDLRKERRGTPRVRTPTSVTLTSCYILSVSVFSRFVIGRSVQMRRAISQEIFKNRSW